MPCISTRYQALPVAAAAVVTIGMVVTIVILPPPPTTTSSFSPYLSQSHGMCTQVACREGAEEGFTKGSKYPTHTFGIEIGFVCFVFDC